MLKLLCRNPGQRLIVLREVGIVIVTFLVEYVVAVVVGQDLVEVNVATNNDDLVVGVTTAVVLVVRFADVVFDDENVVCVAADVLPVAGYIVVFLVVAVDGAVVSYVDA